jgi:hypothetical protein
MVYVARGTLDRAEREAVAGVDAQRQQLRDRTPLPAVGFHWLLGMLLAARGDAPSAVACFEEEIAAASTHIYGREFAINAHVAIGFLKLAAGERDAADSAFAAARHNAKSTVGRYALDRDRSSVDAAVRDLMDAGRNVEAGLVTAGALIVEGKGDLALARLDGLLATAPAGPAGWIIPIDPMLAAIRDHTGTPALFAKLAARAA